MLVPSVYALVQEATKDTPGPSLLSLLAFRRGGVLVVDSPYREQWRQLLSSEDADDLLADLVVRDLPLTDSSLGKIGISHPGVFLVNKSGQVIVEWSGPPPKEFREALRQAGWISTSDEFQKFLKENPDRVDVRWRWLTFLESVLARRQSPQVLEQFAHVLDDLLRQPDWAQVPNVFTPPFYPLKELKADTPLSEVARNRIETVREVVRHSPELSPAWRVLALLTVWHPDDPRISDFISEIRFPPGEDFDIVDWPSSEAISVAETQLRRLKDWGTMRRFAQIRLTALDNQAAKFNGGAMDEWSGKLIVTSKKVTRISRRELATAGRGKWLLLLFEAELREGRVGAASDVAQRLIQEADSESRQKALSIAEEAKAPSLVELLRLKR